VPRPNRPPAYRCVRHLRETRKLCDPDCDLVILGGGSGGYAAAFRAADLGQSVVLIEKDKLGGTCLHYGCIPTKALLHAAEIADNSARASSSASRRPLPASTSTCPQVQGRRGHPAVQGTTGHLQGPQDHHSRGEGRLVSPTAVEVNGERYEGKHVILATGSVPKSLPGLQIDRQPGHLLQRCADPRPVPASVVILGGGVIGVEFASVWKSFGADVTIVEALPHLLPPEDEASSKLLERRFRRRGINFELGTRFAGVQYTDAGVAVSLENGKQIEAELLLVAVGRGPVSADLGYVEAGVRSTAAMSSSTSTARPRCPPSPPSGT